MRNIFLLLASFSLTAPLMAGTIVKLHPAPTPARAPFAPASSNQTLNRPNLNLNLNQAAQPAVAALTSPAGAQQSFKAVPAAPVTTTPADMAAYLASLAKLHGKLPNYEVAAPAPVTVQAIPQDDFHLSLMSSSNMHGCQVNEMYGYGDVTPLIGPKLEHKTVMVTIGTSSSRQRLARVTAYWVGEAGGDVWTDHHQSSTGVALHIGHCAVDPKVIPYGSVVQIPGLGQFLAVDTGGAVISRLAALRSANNGAERDAVVIDLFFENRRDGENFAAHAPSYTTINWWTPTAMAATGKGRLKRHFLAQEDGKPAATQQF